MSLMVLAAAEDKTYLGASVASPSMPWAWGDDSVEKVSGPYHLVWSRDLYHVATAQLAAGDRAAAERSLDFLLFRQQLPDGSFPQNSEVDGAERWDEAARPGRVPDRPRLAAEPDRGADMERIRRAGEYLLKNGPLTGQERWENQRGWSPATIAAEIAGLIAGADLLRRTGDPATAARWEATADSWQRSVQAWTATSNGPLSDLPYYLRITKDRAPNRPTTFNNGDSGPSAADQRRVVDPSFLELVRLGVKPADDPVIVNTRAGRRRPAQAASRVGTFWHRFSFDGYGETSTGRPWKIGEPDTYVTYGRAWPLLTGERGEYELLAGRPATDHLRWMAGAASSGLMLPEQVWDGRPPSSGVNHTPGKGTFSATPLAWTHAQFVRLALSIDAGAPVERPRVVACRYAVACPVDPSRLHRMDERALAERLMTYDSSTPEGLRNAAAFVQGWLGSHEIEHDVRDFDGLPGHPRRRSGRRSGRPWSCTATSTSSRRTDEQFAPRVEGDRLIGRGAYDMKGGARRDDVRARRRRAPARACACVFMCVPDEESEDVERRSTDTLVAEGLRGDFAITGEPTDLHIGVQAKGVLAIRVAVLGTAAHGSTPWLGDNAILKAHDVFRRIETLPFSRESSELFDRPSISLERHRGRATRSTRSPTAARSTWTSAISPTRSRRRSSTRSGRSADLEIAQVLHARARDRAAHEPVRPRAARRGRGVRRR